MSIFGIIRVVMAALHDVSKHDDTRLDPKTNASDTRAQRDATNTTSIHPVTDATTTKGFLKTGSGQVLGNDGSNNVGLFGFDSTGTMVVKVAKPGFDANTAGNANLIFNSNQDAFKIAKTGTTTLNGNATAGVPIIVTIPHGLSFVPIAMVYFNYASAYLPTPNGTGFSVVGGQVTFNNWSWSSTDATNLYINFYSGATTDWGIIPYRYYLLQETAN